MKVGVYAVYDVCSAVYDGPVPATTDAVAVRNFSNMCRNPESAIGTSPEDYTLFRVGTWNDANGEITPEAPQKLVNGLECVAKEFVDA